MMQLDEAGDWCLSARRRPSPNSDVRPRGVPIDLLVIHGISLPAGQFGTGCPAQLFLNCLDLAAHKSFESLRDVHVSAHALIERDGSLTQFVPFTARAWHAGISCFDARERCNDFSIGVELEGSDEIPYTREQYFCLAELTVAIQKHFVDIDRSRIVGHCDIAPGRKTDPGPAFDWTILYRLLDELGPVNP